MNSNNLDTKLSTEFAKENASTENQKSNSKLNPFHIVSFLFIFIGTGILLYFSAYNKQNTLNAPKLKPIILSEERKPEGNWIDTIFKITDIKYSIRLLSTIRNNIDVKDVDIYINGTLIKPNKTTSIDPQLTYLFTKTGFYNVKFNIKKTLTTMDFLFWNNENIVSAKFLPGFDSSQVTSMESMFMSSNIHSLDMSSLNTDKLTNLRSFIKINNYQYHDKTSKILNNPIIDISSFNTSNVKICAGMILEIHEDVIIKISNKFTKCLEQLPYFNKIINIDEELCHNNFKDCIKCIGSQETLRCGECREGFRLMKNGQCKKIENYFVATYNAISITIPTHFLNLDEKFLTIYDFDIYIDERKILQIEHLERNDDIEHRFLSYTFKKIGMHEVKIIFKRTPTNLKKLFYLCSDLIKIQFSDTFDTSKVQTMAYMFAECTSLKSLDISSFDTSRVADYMQMFQSCSELTSLDLSNFNTINAVSFFCTFDSMTKLEYLDISSFISPYLPGGALITHSGSDKTTVVLNNSFGSLYIIYLPWYWKRIYKD